MQNKKLYITIGISTLIASAGIYFYIQSKKFKPTSDSINEPVTIEIDSSMVTSPDTQQDVAALPSDEFNSISDQMNNYDNQDFYSLYE